MHIYFVYFKHEFIRTEPIILGTYFTKIEAIKRIESFPNIKNAWERGVGGNFRRTTNNSVRLWIKKFPIGDCECSLQGV